MELLRERFDDLRPTEETRASADAYFRAARRSQRVYDEELRPLLEAGPQDPALARAGGLYTEAERSAGAAAHAVLESKAAAARRASEDALALGRLITRSYHVALGVSAVLACLVIALAWQGRREARRRGAEWRPGQPAAPDPREHMATTDRTITPARSALVVRERSFERHQALLKQLSPDLFNRHSGGMSAVEVALLMPVLVLLVFGAIELGLIIFTYNAAGHAAWSVTRRLATNQITSGDAASAALAQLPSWVRSRATVTPGSTSSDPLTNQVSVTIRFPATAATPTQMLGWAYGAMTLTARSTMQQEPN